MHQRMIFSYPLAFGEVGIKERVKNVLDYRKPSFWIVLAGTAVCIITAICFLSDPKQKDFDIRIAIPAKSEEAYFYSDEEVCAKGNKITLYSAEPSDHIKAYVLVPAEIHGTKENPDITTYTSETLPVTFNVRKENWYRIGIYVSGPYDADVDVRVHVEDVQVRIGGKE